MSTTYNTKAGDTFEGISRAEYGTELEAGRIQAANPGVAEPLSPGTALAIPTLIRNVAAFAPSDSPEEVALLIGGKRFRFWETLGINRAIDSMDKIVLKAPFNAKSEEFRETFRPFSYKPLEVLVGGEPLFTGVLMGVDPVVSAKDKSIQVTGYSLPGVLNDCTPPAPSPSLEFSGYNLREIASSLANPFGLKVVFDADAGAPFERAALAPDKKILGFLIELAKQRGILTSSTAAGALLFPSAAERGTPVARLSQGASPVRRISPSFNPQGYYSSVTGIEPASLTSTGSQYTVRNPHASGFVRPFVFTATDVLGADIKAATEAKAARMFGSVVSYEVELSSWLDPQRDMWAPNTFVTLLAPDAMIYKETSLFVHSVAFERDENVSLATLTLVLPGSFSSTIPEELPWLE